jgi:hypothetical protein
VVGLEPLLVTQELQGPEVNGEGIGKRVLRYLLSTAPQNKVTIVSKRHTGNLLAGIQKNSLDTGLRRYDELTVDSYLC